MVICFTLTHIPNPRINKRIYFFKKFADVHVVCARRNSQNLWDPPKDIDHRIYDIDLPGANHLIKRALYSGNFQKKIMKEFNDIKPDVIYAEGFDIMIIAAEYKKKHDVKIVFEVADLRERFFVRQKKLLDRLITKMVLRKEKEVFKYIDCLVITSPKFYEIHYNTLISQEKVVYIPNAPDLTAFKTFEKKKDGVFTIGFIGSIRYLSHLKMLIESSEISKTNVYIAGAGPVSEEYNAFMAYCKEKDFIEFSGRYDYNKEIAKIYGKVDCVYAVYDADNPNVKIALPNKLYESVYCELPIIVAQNTYLGELVSQWGLGVCVNHNDKSSLTKAINILKTMGDEYTKIVESCKKNKDKILSEGKRVNAILDILNKQ